MECAIHSGRASVGYCKKCGKFGCADCMIKVALTGQVGKKLDATEALLCRECLGKARPDLVLPDSDSDSGRAPTIKSGQLGSERVVGIPKKYAASSRTSSKASRPARSGSGVGGIFKIAAAAGAIVAVVAAVMILRSRPNSYQDEGIPPDTVAAFALEALFDGDAEGFLSCVDVPAFMCSMDDTGIMRMDYAEADGEKRKKLEALHADILSEVFLVSDNMRREYTLVSAEVGDSSVSIRVKPWIAYGKRSYRRVVLEKKMGRWRISGLASPDF